MNNDNFSKQIVRYLNAGTDQLSNNASEKLRRSREQALTAYREPIRVLGLVTVTGRVKEPAYLVRQPLFWLPILAVLASLWVMQSQSTDDIYDDSGVIDAKLLTGELPFDAFLDKDFATWVKEKEADQ
jgi:hypothetical protein